MHFRQRYWLSLAVQTFFNVILPLSFFKKLALKRRQGRNGEHAIDKKRAKGHITKYNN